MSSTRGSRIAAHWTVTAVVAGLVLGTLSLAAPDEGGRGDNEPREAAAAVPEKPPRPCPKGPVALTFDDGPSRTNTDRIATILADQEVPATFFVLGRLVAADPQRTRMLADAGHRIHNHTYDHPNLTGLSDGAIVDQLERTNEALDAAGVRRSYVVRPPYGAKNARVRQTLRANDYKLIMWTVDTRDWQSRSTDDIASTAIGGLDRRANILMHDTERTDATVDALPRIIRRARAKGHCFGVINDSGKVVRADG